MKILFSETKKTTYKWGLNEGYQVAGLYVTFNSIDSSFRGSCEVTVDTTIFEIGGVVYEIEKIILPSGRVKKNIRKF